MSDAVFTLGRLLLYLVAPMAVIAGSVAIMLRVPLYWGLLMCGGCIFVGAVLSIVIPLSGLLSLLGFVLAIGWGFALFAGPYANPNQITIWVFCIGILFGLGMIVLSEIVDAVLI